MANWQRGSMDDVQKQCLDEREMKEVTDCIQMAPPEFHNEGFVFLERVVPILKDPVADTGDLNVSLKATEKAMSIVVEKYFAGFNKTIHNYSIIAEHMTTINEGVRKMQTGLRDSKARLLNSENTETRHTKDIAVIHQECMTYRLVLKHIQTIKWLMQVPQEIQSYVQNQYFLHAVVLLNRACSYGEDPAIQRVAGLKTTLQELASCRSDLLSVFEIQCEKLTMQVALDLAQTKYTKQELEYMRSRVNNQFPHFYEHADADAPMAIDENIALPADADYLTQLMCLVEAAQLLGERNGDSMLETVIVSNKHALDQVFCLHRLSVTMKDPGTMAFLDTPTTQKIRSRTQHLNVIDRFEMCLKVVLRLMQLYVDVCARLLEYKEKLARYRTTIEIKDITLQWNRPSLLQMSETAGSAKRNKWIAKFKQQKELFEQRLEGKEEEQPARTGDFFQSTLLLVWNAVQNYLLQVLNYKVLEDEALQAGGPKDFSFYNASEGSEREEQQSERYRMTKKKLTTENVLKLLKMLEHFTEGIKTECRFRDEHVRQLTAFVRTRREQLNERRLAKESLIQ